MRTCKGCKTKYEPVRPLQTTCSIPCALTLVRTKQDKIQRKITRDARQRLKTRAQWLREAQAAFNAWIRARDIERTCIDCGKWHQSERLTGGEWDCGHYRSVGSCPELRFEPLNAHKQLKKCNQFMSGRAVDYRIGLIQRIGLANVEWLEGPHQPKKYTIDDLIVIRNLYREKLKEWQKERL